MTQNPQNAIDTWRKGDVEISTRKERLDLDFIHAALEESYWARGIPLEIVRRSLDNSFVFGVYDKGKQVGVARVVTDFATFAYLADVYIDPAARGRGLAVWLMDVITQHERLQGLRRWLLATKDAHGLYRRSGFRALEHPEVFMEINAGDIYSRIRS